MAVHDRAAIIAAAGRGDRARSADFRPKQFRDLRGRPLWTWALDPIIAAGCDPVVVAVPNGSEHHVQRIAPKVTVVVGGSTRQESVRIALNAIESPLVIVHDGARPFATASLIDRLTAALGAADGAIPYVPITETLKELQDSVVTRTVARSSLVRVQTPQLFKTEALKHAHLRALTDGYEATDDAELVERVGGRVTAVEGDPWNIKVTLLEDFEVAERILAGRAP